MWCGHERKAFHFSMSNSSVTIFLKVVVTFYPKPCITINTLVWQRPYDLPPQTPTMTDKSLKSDHLEKKAKVESLKRVKEEYRTRPTNKEQQQQTLVF